MQVLKDVEVAPAVEAGLAEAKGEAEEAMAIAEQTLRRPKMTLMHDDPDRHPRRLGLIHQRKNLLAQGPGLIRRGPRHRRSLPLQCSPVQVAAAQVRVPAAGGDDSEFCLFIVAE